MSGIPHDHYEPKTGVEKWIESRLPVLGLIYSTLFIPTPKNLNWMWIWGIVLAFCLALQIATGVVLVMHYTAEHRARLRLGRAHHAQRQRRLGAALRARQRRVAVLLRGLLPHLPGHLLRVLQDPARDHLDHRHADLPPDDGDRLHGLRAALGADVVLGRHRDHRPLLGDPAHRARHPDLAARRAGGRQPDAEPLLLAALPPAVRDRRPRDRPHLGVPHHRQQQPDRRRGAAHLARPRPTRTRCRSGPTSSSRTCSRWSSCW